MKRTVLFFAALLITAASFAQDAVKARGLTMAEYQKAKTFKVASLDNDTYVKFENTYVLDRYEGRKPYIITGTDGLKKRIDLYKLILKEGMQELGMVIYYTSETGKLYTAVMPNFTTDGKVWEQYFDDIDNINKIEKNYVLKVSYVLSKEFGFQVFKNQNQGKDVSKEAGTYGTDICFPGEEEVAMADGSKKLLKEVKAGDRVITIDAETKAAKAVTVKELTTHEAKNYAITSLTLVSAVERKTASGIEVRLAGRQLSATPNHPMRTLNGDRRIGDVTEGEEVLCLNEKTGKYEPFTVLTKTESAGGTQKVFNIVADGGDTFLMNGVMVKQK